MDCITRKREEMEAALTAKKPALPPRPDSSCSHTSSVTYLSRISQLELLNQELEVQLQVSLAENLKLKEQLKRYASEEGRWSAADLVIQELKKQLSVLTDENFTLNSTLTSQQAQITALQAIPAPALRSLHTKSRSLAADNFSHTLLSTAPGATKDSVASVSVHIRDIRPALTEASAEDLHIQTVSLTEVSGNHLPLQSFYKTAVRGRRDMENTRPMGSDRSGSVSRQKRGKKLQKCM
jgi:hypothetical protein